MEALTDSRARRLADLVTQPVRLVAALTFALLSILAASANHVLLAVDEPLSNAARGTSQLGLWRAVTVLGETSVAVPVAVVVAVCFWRRCRPLAFAYPVTLLLGVVVSNTLKHLTARPRPPQPATEVALASFPSGHTLQATLLLGFLPLVVVLLANRRWMVDAAALGAVVGIAAVGYSRVYLGAHWPTDVVGSVLLGTGLILAVERLLTVRLETDQRSDRPPGEVQA